MKKLIFLTLLAFPLLLTAQTYILKKGTGDARDDFSKTVYLKKITDAQFYFYISTESSSYTSQDFCIINFKKNTAVASPNPFGVFTIVRKPNALDVLFTPKKGGTEPKMREYSGVYKLHSVSVPKTLPAYNGSLPFSKQSIAKFYAD